MEINETKGKIWDILSDIGNMQQWMPQANISISDSTNIGVGTRYSINSVRDNNNYEIVTWDKNHKLASKIVGEASVLKTFLTEWLLKSSGNSTLVTLTASYEMRFGILGSIIDKLVLRNAIEREYRGALFSLKRFVETGEINASTKTRENYHLTGQKQSQTSTINQTNDIYRSQPVVANQSESMFSSKPNTSDQHCKKCFGGLNEHGKCNQCDKKW